MVSQIDARDGDSGSSYHSNNGTRKDLKRANMPQNFRVSSLTEVSGSRIFEVSVPAANKKTKDYDVKDLTSLLRKGFDKISSASVHKFNIKELKLVEPELRVMALCKDKNYAKLREDQKAAFSLERSAYLSAVTIKESKEDPNLFHNFPVLDLLPVSVWALMDIQFRTDLLNHFWEKLEYKKVEMILTVTDVKWNSLDPSLALKFLRGSDSRDQDAIHAAELRVRIRDQIMKTCAGKLQLKYTKKESAEIIHQFLEYKRDRNYLVSIFRPNFYNEAQSIVDFDLKKPLNDLPALGLALAASKPFLFPVLHPEKSKEPFCANPTMKIRTFNLSNGNIVLISKTFGNIKNDQSIYLWANEYYLTKLQDNATDGENRLTIPEAFAEAAQSLHQFLNINNASMNHMGILAVQGKDKWQIFTMILGDLHLLRIATENFIPPESIPTTEFSLGATKDRNPNLKRFSYAEFTINKGDGLYLDHNDAIAF